MCHREDNNSFKMMSQVWGCGLANLPFLVFSKWLTSPQAHFMKERKVFMIFILKMVFDVRFGFIFQNEHEFSELSLFSFTGQMTNLSLFTVVHVRTLYIELFSSRQVCQRAVY